MDKFSLKQLRAWFGMISDPADVPVPPAKKKQPDYDLVGEHRGIQVYRLKREPLDPSPKHTHARENERRQRQRTR